MSNQEDEGRVPHPCIPEECKGSSQPEGRMPQILLVGGDDRQRSLLERRFPKIRVRQIRQGALPSGNIPQANHIFVYTKHLSHSTEEIVHSKKSPHQIVHMCSSTNSLVKEVSEALDVQPAEKRRQVGNGVMVAAVERLFPGPPPTTGLKNIARKALPLLHAQGIHTTANSLYQSLRNHVKKYYSQGYSPRPQLLPDLSGEAENITTNTPEGPMCSRGTQGAVIGQSPYDAAQSPNYGMVSPKLSQAIEDLLLCVEELDGLRSSRAKYTELIEIEKKKVEELTKERDELKKLLCQFKTLIESRPVLTTPTK